MKLGFHIQLKYLQKGKIDVIECLHIFSYMKLGKDWGLVDFFYCQIAFAIHMNYASNVFDLEVRHYCSSSCYHIFLYSKSIQINFNIIFYQNFWIST